jgi:regulator of replication initiation timing
MHSIDYALHNLQRVAQEAQNLTVSHEAQAKTNKELVQLNNRKASKCGLYLAENQTLKTDNANLRKSVADLEVRETTQTTRVTHLQAQIEEFKSTSTVTDSEIQRYQSTIGSMSRELRELKDRVSSLNDALMQQQEQQRNVGQESGNNVDHPHPIPLNLHEGMSHAHDGVPPVILTTTGGEGLRPSASQSSAVGGLTALNTSFHHSPDPPLAQLEDCDCGSCHICVPPGRKRGRAEL